MSERERERGREEGREGVSNGVLMFQPYFLSKEQEGFLGDFSLLSAVPY